jgi:hypothetical protein
MTATGPHDNRGQAHKSRGAPHLAHHSRGAPRRVRHVQNSTCAPHILPESRLDAAHKAAEAAANSAKEAFDKTIEPPPAPPAEEPAAQPEVIEDTKDGGEPLQEDVAVHTGDEEDLPVRGTARRRKSVRLIRASLVQADDGKEHEEIKQDVPPSPPKPDYPEDVQTLIKGVCSICRDDELWMG